MAAVPTRAICLSDSIPKYCYTPNHCDIHSVRGATTQRLITKVRQNLINWLIYGLVIIHVGTNDIANGDGASMLLNTVILCNEIKCRNPDIKIVISAIIPRVIDFVETDHIIKGINRDLKRFCDHSTSPDFHFHPTYNSFQKCGWPDLTGNYWAKDDLHLADRGIKRMNAIIKNLVALWRRGVIP